MIIGIDPGAKGGMALLNERGEVLDTVKLDGMKELEVNTVLRAWLTRCPAMPVFFIEKVQHIKGDGAGGSFTFGAVFGLLRGLVIAHSGKAPRYVYPMMWQSAMGCMSGGAKNITKDRAIALFPVYASRFKHSIQHGNADAILIAEYGRRLLMRESEGGIG